MAEHLRLLQRRALGALIDEGMKADVWRNTYGKRTTSGLLARGLARIDIESFPIWAVITEAGRRALLV